MDVGIGLLEVIDCLLSLSPFTSEFRLVEGDRLFARSKDGGSRQGFSHNGQTHYGCHSERNHGHRSSTVRRPLLHGITSHAPIGTGRPAQKPLRHLTVYPSPRKSVHSVFASAPKLGRASTTLFAHRPGGRQSPPLLGRASTVAYFDGVRARPGGTTRRGAAG